MRVEMSKKERTKKWNDIEVGECFVYDNRLYMKKYGVNGYNAICLNTGSDKCFLDDNDRFKVVSAHVVVE